jgi:hypothetical protein
MVPANRLGLADADLSANANKTNTEHNIMILKISALIAILAFAAFAVPTATEKRHDPVSGEWNVVFSIQGHTAEGVLKLKLNGAKVTGTIESEHTGPGTIAKGTWVDGKLSFTMEFAKHESIVTTGAVKDGSLTGDFATEGTTGTWKATKKP